MTDPLVIKAAIEDAMIARMKAAQDAGALGYKLKKIATYGGEFSDAISELVRDFPAVLFVFLGARRISHTNMRTEFNARFAAIVCAQNLRSEEAARHGKDGKVGSYKIINDVVALLGNQTFGLEIKPLVPDSINPLFNDKADKKLASIYTVEFFTTFEIAMTDDTPDLADFKTFHVNWDIPPRGNVAPPLPDDDDSDATDHVTLENSP